MDMMDGGDSVSNGDVSNRFTHDAKADLSLRWAHKGFFVILMHSCSILMNRVLRKPCSL